ncbi:heme ABC exporter ATP-binding protein CcmA [uncultured Bartonella sp.]|uniref:heme ABC exporter ATP-binding protein CcmA n=1 Tax=uncultured Bartonella sp. TaxID=104108 RepID=UPI00262AE25A|nr:heme ABC exporter ATP-binding protein CcmA [uncultured Bartonella sp.]
MQISAFDLSAKRGEDTLFQHLDFTLHSTELMTITGPNGIGKSTLLRIIAGFLAPDKGQVVMQEGQSDFPVALACHYLGSQNAMKTHLSVLQNLEFWEKFDNAPLLSPQQALDQVELSGIEQLPFGVLSTGQKRRVAIARLLLSYQSLWILDEPTSGLDKQASAIFSKIMHDHLERSGMIIAATHLPLGIEENCNILLDNYLPEFEES